LDDDADLLAYAHHRVTFSQFWAWHVSRQCTFSSAPALGSTGSAMEHSTLFAGFIATMAGSDFLRPFVIGDGSRLPDADQRSANHCCAHLLAKRKISQVPAQSLSAPRT